MRSYRSIKAGGLGQFVDTQHPGPSDHPSLEEGNFTEFVFSKGDQNIEGRQG